MPGNPHTSVRSRQVAAELRALREAKGMSCAEVGKRLGVSGSKMSRIETGMTGLQVEDVAALLGLYQVPADKRTELLDQVRRSDERGWWERQPGLPQLWRSLIDFESKAARIQNFEPLFIPGLLQTAEYSRAIIEGSDPTLSEAELDNLVATRMARQTVLSRSRSPQFLAVIDEGTLHRPVGAPGVMTRQLRQLIDWAGRPHVGLRVVPASAGAYAGMRGPFVILEFDDEPDLIFLENHDTGLFLEEDADLAAYRLALRNILSSVLAADASLDLISAILTEEA